MAKQSKKTQKAKTLQSKATPAATKPRRTARPSALLDTRIVYCGDCLDQLPKLPDDCIDLIYIDPPFNSNRNYEVFWGETKEKLMQEGGLLDLVPSWAEHLSAAEGRPEEEGRQEMSMVSPDFPDFRAQSRIRSQLALGALSFCR